MKYRSNRKYRNETSWFTPLELVVPSCTFLSSPPVMCCDLHCSWSVHWPCFSPWRWPPVDSRMYIPCSPEFVALRVVPLLATNTPRLSTSILHGGSIPNLRCAIYEVLEPSRADQPCRPPQSRSSDPLVSCADCCPFSVPLTT